MIRKVIFIIILIIVYSDYLSAQEVYYLTDSVLTYTSAIVDKGEIENAKACHILKNREIILLSPEEVLEYCLEDGRKYFSREINTGSGIERVFLERLSYGDIDLYYYRERGLKTFFIETDNTGLKELPRKDRETGSVSFREYLEYLTGTFEPVSGLCYKASYTRHSLYYFVFAYNEGLDIKLPYNRYGVKFRMGNTRYFYASERSASGLAQLKYSYFPDFGFGLFMELPFYKNKIDLVVEMGMRRNRFMYYGSGYRTEYILIADIIGIELPLTAKYYIGNRNIKPYILGGPVLGFNFRSEGDLYCAVATDDMIDITLSDVGKIIPDREAGISLGAGVNIPVKAGFSILAEMSGSYIMPLLQDANLKKTSLQFSFGLIY